MEKFITIQLRESTGKCQPVHDAVMVNLGIDRMGYCEACGHEIINHFGVYHSDFGYKWVGKCCKSILCKPDAIQINPDAGTRFLNAKGCEQVVLSKKQAVKFGDSIFSQANKEITHHIGSGCYEKIIPCFDNNYSCSFYSNDFYFSIFNQMVENFKYTGIYTVSSKQFACIEKLIK